MNIENLLKTGAQAFISRLGSGADGQLSLSNVVNALLGLLGDGKGGLDLNGLLSNMQGEGLAAVAQSWLGDGSNSGISVEQITRLFSQEKLSAFAGQLGLGQEQAVEGLQGAIPTMVDQASSGGQLLESLGGAGGLLGMAKSLLGR